ncbi:MAG: phosphopantetheine-binding protein [Paludibacteraceae bacterium]|nr:phosphopantetheine-binding protein [Paludibacteraceae bacterium]
MGISEIIEKTNGLLREEFEIEGEMSPVSRLKEDLDIDSLDIVDVVVLVHDTFGVTLKLDDLKKMKTLQDLYDYLVANIG